jgi:probable HAF family extracellular repeat protein
MGQVVGYADLPNGYTHAFVWDATQGIRELPSSPNESSQAVAINVLSQALGVDFGIGAVIWDLPSGNITPFPGGRDLNNLGQAVGGASLVEQDHTIRMLIDLIPSGSGWEIENAFAINDAGEIVGYGLLDGDVRGFLMTPVPEPI